MRKYGLDWWIIEVIGFLLSLMGGFIIAVYSYPTLINNTILIGQKIIIGVGVLTLCFGWGYTMGELVKKFRKMLRRRKNNK